MIRLYDTATRGLQPVPTDAAQVGLYVCGITPYDGGHLGHAFTYHTFDVLTRRLRGLGVGVRSVRNITDVDDDMIRVSAERGIGWEDWPRGWSATSTTTWPPSASSTSTPPPAPVGMFRP